VFDLFNFLVFEYFALKENIFFISQTIFLQKQQITTSPPPIFSSSIIRRRKGAITGLIP
jgi:hypothetical protein